MLKLGTRHPNVEIGIWAKSAGEVHCTPSIQACAFKARIRRQVVADRAARKPRMEAVDNVKQRTANRRVVTDLPIERNRPQVGLPLHADDAVPIRWAIPILA